MDCGGLIGADNLVIISGHAYGEAAVFVAADRENGDPGGIAPPAGLSAGPEKAGLGLPRTLGCQHEIEAGVDGGVQLLHNVYADALRGAVEEIPLLGIQQKNAVALLSCGLLFRDGEKDLTVDQRGIAHLRFFQGQGYVGPPQAVRPQGDAHRSDLPELGQKSVVRAVPGGQHHRPLPHHQHGLHHGGFRQGALPKVVEQVIRPAAAEIGGLRRQKAPAAGNVFQVGAVPGEMAHDVVIHRLSGFGQLSILPVH